MSPLMAATLFALAVGAATPAHIAAHIALPGVAPLTAHARPHVPAAVNPHLHGLPASERSGKASAHATERHHEVTHREWDHRWAYTTWINSHRGLGTIRGQVLTGDGAAIRGARVWLRHANGAAFRASSSKHTTVSGMNGSFAMFAVRADRYRLVARSGGHAAHAPVSLAAGSTETAVVRF